MELSFPRTFAPGSESSIGGTFAPQHELSVIYTDFTLQKAFDKVFHNRLISKLWFVLIRHLLTVRMHMEICSVDCTLVKNDPNSSPRFSYSFRATKKLKARASSTKSQQLRALKFLFYTALQITFLF